MLITVHALVYIVLEIQVFGTFIILLQMSLSKKVALLVTDLIKFSRLYVYLISRWGIERLGILFGPIVARDHANSSGRSRPSDEGAGGEGLGAVNQTLR